MKKKYHTVGTAKCNRKLVDRSLSWHGTDISIKSSSQDTIVKQSSTLNQKSDCQYHISFSVHSLEKKFQQCVKKLNADESKISLNFSRNVL